MFFLSSTTFNNQLAFKISAFQKLSTVFYRLYTILSKGACGKLFFVNPLFFNGFSCQDINSKPFYPQAVRFIRRSVDKFTKPCIIGLLSGFFAANTNVCSYVKFLRFVLDNLFFLNYANPPNWREIRTLR